MATKKKSTKSNSKSGKQRAVLVTTAHRGCSFDVIP